MKKYSDLSRSFLLPGNFYKKIPRHGAGLRWLEKLGADLVETSQSFDLVRELAVLKSGERGQASEPDGPIWIVLLRARHADGDGFAFGDGGESRQFAQLVAANVRISVVIKNKAIPGVVQNGRRESVVRCLHDSFKHGIPPAVV